MVVCTLQDIGLTSLTSIMRGSIRVEKNPVLCYIDTIDWGYIAVAGEEHFIKVTDISSHV